MSYSWQVNCIEAGLEQPGYIAEVIGLHGACSFTFDPMAPEQFEQFEELKEREVAKNGAANGRIMVGQLLSKRIKKWDIVDKDGKPVAITEASCRKIRTAMQSKMYQIIAGIRATDIDPKWIEGDASEFKSLEDLEPISKQLGN